MIKPRSLNFYTTFILVFIAVFSAGCVGIIANIGTGIKFKKYIQEKHENRNEMIVNILKKSYTLNGNFDKKAIETIDMYAMMDNLKINIFDEKGEKIWYADYIGHSMEMNGLVTMGTYVANKKMLSFEKLNIVDKNRKIGSIEIEYDGKYALSQKDINFLKEFNNWVFFSGIISIAISLLFGRIFSAGIVRPIKRVNDAAKRIGNGELDVEIDRNGRISEAVELTDTINGMAKSLKEQKNLRKQLVSDMSHEIRTPLATIQSHMEAIIDGVWEPTKDRIESIYDEIKRLSKLVKDIGKIDEIENSEVKLEKSRFDMSESIKSIVNNFIAEAVNKNVGIVMEEMESSEIEADIDKFKQIAVNLISNSIKYSKEKGIIRISVKNRDGKKILKIEDNGIGISKEHLPYIFERFYRADSSRARSTGGTGIGLTVVKSIVDAHGWKIRVDSKEGEGTKIEIEI